MVVDVTEVKKILIVILIKLDLHMKFAVGSPFRYGNSTTRIKLATKLHASKPGKNIRTCRMEEQWLVPI